MNASPAAIPHWLVSSCMHRGLEGVSMAHRQRHAHAHALANAHTLTPHKMCMPVCTGMDLSIPRRGKQQIISQSCLAETNLLSRRAALLIANEPHMSYAELDADVFAQAVRKLLDDEFPHLRYVETSTLHKAVPGARHSFLNMAGTDNKLDHLAHVCLTLCACLLSEGRDERGCVGACVHERAWARSGKPSLC